jgi:hypothetical protein
MHFVVDNFTLKIHTPLIKLPKTKGMKKTNTYLIFFVLLIQLMSCAKKGKPNSPGQLMSAEQLLQMPKDSSWNRKVVSIEGYAGYCKIAGLLRMGTKNKLDIYTEADCEGKKLLPINIDFKNSTALSGEQFRNYVNTKDKKEFQNSDLIFTTDDYQEIANTKLKFSGSLIYQNNTYYLDDITIHKPQ